MFSLILKDEKALTTNLVLIILPLSFVILVVSAVLIFFLIKNTCAKIILFDKAISIFFKLLACFLFKKNSNLIIDDKELYEYPSLLLYFYRVCAISEKKALLANQAIWSLILNDKNKKKNIFSKIILIVKTIIVKLMPIIIWNLITGTPYILWVSIKEAFSFFITFYNTFDIKRSLILVQNSEIDNHKLNDIIKLVIKDGVLYFNPKNNVFFDLFKYRNSPEVINCVRDLAKQFKAERDEYRLKSLVSKTPTSGKEKTHYFMSKDDLFGLTLTHSLAKKNDFSIFSINNDIYSKRPSFLQPADARLGKVLDIQTGGIKKTQYFEMKNGCKSVLFSIGSVKPEEITCFINKFDEKSEYKTMPTNEVVYRLKEENSVANFVQIDRYLAEDLNIKSLEERQNLIKAAYTISQSDFDIIDILKSFNNE